MVGFLETNIHSYYLKVRYLQHCAHLLNTIKSKQKLNCTHFCNIFLPLIDIDHINTLERETEKRITVTIFRKRNLQR